MRRLGTGYILSRNSQFTIAHIFTQSLVCSDAVTVVDVSVAAVILAPVAPVSSEIIFGEMAREWRSCFVLVESVI